ncbi:MAG: hypothetical protein P8K78_05625 [Pirellulales bacterium]|nr:hypothetical protein [Pirellulales bacterium]
MMQQSFDLPAWWRLAVIVAGALILCSCRGVQPAGTLPTGPAMPPTALAPPPADLPPQAARGWAPPCSTWSPPGIQRPWPNDEYIFDGGDRERPAKIEADWTVKGLHLEDTIAHFDTLDGQTLISPSNRVCVYAPRFGSVRLVLGVDGYEGKESLIRYDTPERVEVREENLVANTTLQQLQTIRAVGSKRPSGQQRNSPGLLLASDTGLLEANGGIKPYENFRILRDGLYELLETAKLAERTEAATIWTLDKGIQIVVDGTPAEVSTGDARAEATFTVDHESVPGLRIVKVASKQAASPGEIVEFTLRYDNVGNEPLGNVTIIDNLTTRLEYVEGSQTASREARFLTQINEGDSLVLRWEIMDPVDQGTGGTIRFQCRVR